MGLGIATDGIAIAVFLTAALIGAVIFFLWVIAYTIAASMNK